MSSFARSDKRAYHAISQIAGQSSSAVPGMRTLTWQRSQEVALVGPPAPTSEAEEEPSDPLPNADCPHGAPASQDPLVEPAGPGVSWYETDAVHVYSDDRHIWLQLRRKVPTEREIGRTSFKAALCLTLGAAHKLGAELLKIAKRNKDNIKAKNAPAATQPPAKSKQPAATPKSK